MLCARLLIHVREVHRHQLTNIVPFDFESNSERFQMKPVSQYASGRSRRHECLVEWTLAPKELVVNVGCYCNDALRHIISIFSHCWSREGEGKQLLRSGSGVEDIVDRCFECATIFEGSSSNRLVLIGAPHRTVYVHSRIFCPSIWVRPV